MTYNFLNMMFALLKLMEHILGDPKGHIIFSVSVCVCVCGGGGGGVIFLQS